MRRVVSAALGAFVATAFLVLADGCTFLVQFDDVPPSVDATDTKPPLRDSGADVADTLVPGTDAEPDAPPPYPSCDQSFPLDQVEGCDLFVDDAEVCADNSGITSYPGDRSKDLVACSKTQGATCVRHCVACAHLPPGYPDQCDQCVDRPDGDYCGTDMGWQPKHFKLLVTCANGRVQAATPCSDKGCASNGGTGGAACVP